MAIAVLILGAVVFFVGVGGQVLVGRRFAKRAPSEDRKGAQIIITIAAIIIGAWLVIAAVVSLLHARGH